MSWRRARQPALGTSPRPTSSGPLGSSSGGLRRTLEEEGCAHLGCVAMTLVSMVLGTQSSLHPGGGTGSDRSGGSLGPGACGPGPPSPSVPQATQDGGQGGRTPSTSEGQRSDREEL